MATKFKLPTVVCALRWDHHESGVRDHHVVSHDCKVHAFNISTFQQYEQLSNLLVFRKAKKKKKKKGLKKSQIKNKNKKKKKKREKI